MEKTGSYKHALNLIKILYAESGLFLKDRTYGEIVTSEFGNDLETEKLGSLFALLDEQIGILKYFYWYFISSLFDDEKDGLYHLRMINSQLDTLISIRILCINGLDLQARMLLRLLYENSITWTRLIVDKEAFADWKNAVLPDEGNKFWHKYISKEKTEKYLRSLTNEKNLFWLGNDKVTIECLKSHLGYASHPTHFSQFLALRNNFSSTKDDSFFLSQTSKHSIFTLMGSMYCTVLPFSLNIQNKFKIKSIDFQKIGHLFDYIICKDGNWDDTFDSFCKLICGIYVFSNKFYDVLKEDDKKSI